MSARWAQAGVGLLVSAVLAWQAALAESPQPGPRDGWSAPEWAVLQTLQLRRLPPAERDPSNAVADIPAAAALGKRLFFDRRLSANGQVACASCHDPARQFQDGKPFGVGLGTGTRRTMALVESGRGAWQFWDGRKDSLWSQALGPMEDPAEHGGSRVAYARQLAAHYRTEYEALFDALPDMAAWPQAAGPKGTAQERAAWDRMSPAERAAASRVFANLGKAIAAYERTLHFTPARLDRYLAQLETDAPAAGTLLTVAEKRGLRLFIGKAACVTCHQGPLLTDHAFHNTGVPPRAPAAAAGGRAAALDQLLRDEFNCLGVHSDARPDECAELAFLATDDPHMVGAFKTPGLRNVAERAPYMHASQFASLEAVVRHYAAAPPAALGTNERKPVPLSATEIADLVQFLGTLSSPVEERISR